MSSDRETGRFDLQQLVFAQCERNNGGCACKVSGVNLAGSGFGAGPRGARCDERYDMALSVLCAIAKANSEGAALHHPADEKAFVELLVAYDEAIAAHIEAPVKEMSAARQRRVAAAEAVVEAYRAASRAPVGLVDGELAELSRKATQGEWAADYFEVPDPDGGPTQTACDGVRTSYTEGGQRVADAGEINSAFIAGSVNFVRRHLAFASSTQPEAAGQAVTLTYTNWEGETADRTIFPTGRMLFTSNKWHPEPQWLVEASGVGFGGVRLFALSGFNGAPKATTQAGDASGGVDVALKEVERLVSEACGNYYQLGLDGNTSGLAGKSFDKALAAIRALSPQSAPLGRADAGAGHNEEAVGSEGLANEIPVEVFDFYGRKAKNLSNLWANATPAARQAILVGLLKAWKSGHARGLEIFKELSDPPTDKAGAAVGGRDAWQPIETAPKDGTEILVCNPEVDCMLVVYHAQEDSHPHPGGMFCWQQPDADVLHAERAFTYWRPLPTPPHPDDGSVKCQDQGGGRG